MKHELHPVKSASVLLLLAVLVVFTVPLYAQKMIISEEAYLKPPQEIMDVVIAPRHNNYTLSNLSPDGVHFLITKSSGLTKLADMAKPFYNLGETEFDPIGNRTRRLTTGTTIGYELFNWEHRTTSAIQAPIDAKVSGASWSPDGSKLAYLAHFVDATHIYIADIETGKSRKLTRVPVLATLVTSFRWTNDGEKIMAVLIPDFRGPEPGLPYVPTEPKVRVTRQGDTTTRTYRFLLKTPHDQELLEYYTTGQIALIDVETGNIQKIGESDMYRSINMSPDGQFFRVTRMLKPFSYFTSMGSFGSYEEMIDINANVLIDTMSYRSPPDISVGDGRARIQSQILQGKSNLGWAPDGNGMTFIQQEPTPKDTIRAEEPEEQEPQRRREPRKYQLMRWLYPFDSTSMELIYEQENNFSNVMFSEDFQMLFARETLEGETQRETRGEFQRVEQRQARGEEAARGGTQHQFFVKLSDPETKYTIYKYDTEDRYNNPGSLMSKRGPFGSSVVRISSDEQYVYLSGTKTDSLPEMNPPFPFIDKVSMYNSEDKVRIFEGDQDAYERVGTALDDDLEQIMVNRETRTEISNTFMHNLKTGEVRKMTNNIDYSPEITRAQRREYTVERVDGFKFFVRVTLPPDYVEGTKLPAMFWFYPREYGGDTMADAQAAYDRGRRATNRNRFPSVGTRSMVILTKLGYAVVEPDCPIVGKPGQMNDHYEQDLRNSLWAVIDHLDKLSLIDRDRLGIGGHSYGAFGTANAMVYTPFFKAGIAGDGNYNRTLTPMSFQSERRNIWDARETYFSMSPLLNAEMFNGALLMYHGMDDANTGTFPINSERMFQALDGLGKDAALYMYPYEHHGPAAEETILDMWTRWVEWLDKYVMNPEKAKEEK